MHTIGYHDDSAGRSGTTQYLLELLTDLDRAKYRPVVFAPRPAEWLDDCRRLDALVITGAGAPAPQPKVQDADSQAGVPPMAWSQRGSLARARRSIALLRGMRGELQMMQALFSRHRVDVLHTNNVGEEVAPVAARRSGAPLVVGTLHVNPSFDLFQTQTGWVHNVIRKRSFAALDLVIAVSERTRDEWKATITPFPEHKVIHNGIGIHRLARRRTAEEAKRLLGLAPDAFVFGSLGRLDWAKGYGDLLAALPSIRAAIPEAVFLHAGRGPLEKQLKAQAEAAGVADAIRWLGFRSDVRDVLEASDLYVQPSWCEAHTLSVLEAGALDLPVVATDVGGHLETLSIDRGGWIVPPRQPEALAKAVIEAAQAATERERRGRWLGHRVREYFTNERMVRETMAAYEALLESPTRS